MNHFKDKPSHEKSETKEHTIIGESVLIKGKLTGDENLIVKGRIEADIETKRSLTIEPSGIVKADVKVNHLKVHGILIGNVIAAEKVEMAPNCKVVGDISTPCIIMSDGASFRGSVDPGRKAEPKPKEKTQSYSKRAPVLPPNDNPEVFAKPSPPALSKIPGSVEDKVSQLEEVSQTEPVVAKASN